MTQINKRILSLILAALTCASLLVACNSGKEAEKTSETVPAPEDADETSVRVTEYARDLATEHKLEGITFVYAGGYQQPEFEEETGNIENDALYKRQRDIEEIFEIDIVNAELKVDSNSTSGHEVVDSVKRAVMAGTKDYDLVAGNFMVVAHPLFNGQCLEDVSSFSVLNLDEQWWPATLRDTHSIAGKLYFLTGPIITNYYGDGVCVLFNKKIMTDFGIEEPYELVKSGEWTFDKMTELASAIPYNTDGAGVYRYGKPNGMGVLYGFGYRVTQFDDEGIPYVEASLPIRLSDIADKVSVIMGDDSQSVNCKYDTLKEQPLDKYGMEYEDMFVADRILFLFNSTDTAASLREKDVEFGILPVPKENKEQRSYYSYADAWSSRFCYVPVCTKDLAVTDVVVEAMAALSLKHIKPAYFDKLLKGRSTYDNDSREMLDTLFNSKVYDIIGIYSLGDINQTGPFVRSIEKAVEYDTTSISSDYMVYAKMANKQIDRIMAMVNR